MDRVHSANYGNCILKEVMAELQLRTGSPNQKCARQPRQPSLEYTFLRCADDPTGPLQKPERVQPQALALAPLPINPLLISPESPVLWLHLLVTPCQFSWLGFTCEPEELA
jgi:hypothetical protein